MRADVCCELDAHAVLCYGRQILECGIVRRELLLFLEFALIEGALLLGRADDDVAAAAVEDDLVAVVDAADLVADAENRRDGARLCDDDDVAGCAAGAEDDARDLLGRHAGDDGRLDLLSAEDDLACTNLWFLDAEDVFRDTLADIAQVDGACGEVLVLHLLKELRLFVCSVEDALRSAACCLDFRFDVFRHHGILHHHAVRFEDRRLLRLLLFAQTFDGREENFGDGNDRRLRLALLLGNAAGMIGCEIAVKILAREHDLTDGNA